MLFYLLKIAFKYLVTVLSFLLKFLLRLEFHLSTLLSQSHVNDHGSKLDVYTCAFVRH